MSDHPPDADVEIGLPSTTVTAGTGRVSAPVGGHELWFECDGTNLSPVIEAFTSALVPAAIGRGVRLVTDVPVDRVWLANVQGVLDVWHEWWSTPRELASVLACPASGDGAGWDRVQPATGLCFSLGVDSFYSLLRLGRPVERLLFAHGFDIPLDDAPRMAHAEAGLRAVADATGCEAVVIRTNLRTHPLGVDMDWPRTHGGALAALGHVSRDAIGELLVSSTKPYERADRPWGSHWRTDPGWSSSRLHVWHVGAEVERTEKLVAIADEPLVQRHLRVCWEKRRPTGNCGACEKCVRTMLTLAGVDRLDDFTAFPDRDPETLAERVDAVPRVIVDLVPVYRTVLTRLRDPVLRRAVEDLLVRSARQ